MRKPVRRLMNEAIRRYILFHAGEPLATAWIGLGCESYYRPAIQEGLMQWHDGRQPYKRTMGWLILTPKGQKEFMKMVSGYLKEFGGYNPKSMHNNFEIFP